MRLLRAQIDGFGRYIGRNFEFGAGLNVVYGKNEAGKSTLQQFVLAMLYGMKKPGRKRAIYLEEEARYRPWQGGIYGGILWVEVEGIVYRIERNLRREDEWARIYREDTGEDLTSRFPQDSRKELSFAEVLWQADRELFVNTCCIGPMAERERASWLLESARQGDGTQDVLATPDQVKIRMAEEAIGKRLESIGSERATSKPLAQRLKKRDEAKRAYQEARDREETQKGARLSAEELTREYQDAVRDEQVLGKELSQKLARYLTVQEAKIGEHKLRLEQLEQTLAEGRQTVANGLDEGVFQEMQQDFQRLLNAKTQVDSYQKRLTVLGEEVKDAQVTARQYASIDEGKLLEVERIASRLEVYEGEKERVEESDSGDDLLLGALEAEHRAQRKKMWIAAVATGICAPFGLLEWWLFILVALWLVIVFYFYMEAGKVEQSMKRVRENSEKQAGLKVTVRAEQERLEAQLLDLLSQFEVDTPRHYRQKWSGVVKAREQVALYEKQVVWLNAELSRAQGERDILARRLLRHLGGEERQPAALDTEQLREEIARWEARFEQFRHLRGQISVWERDRERFLFELEADEKEVDRWQEIARQMGIAPEPPSLFAPSPVTSQELDGYYQSWREAERLLLDKKSLYAEANTRYKTLREGVKPAAEILLEWERSEEELGKLIVEREALLVAQDVFAEVKEELYRATAPRFAAALSAVTERVTAGRYQEVYLDREKSISTISPDSGYTVDLETLSAGTIDQITFALGLSMSGISIPGGERLPLLFDEPFRRYDDERLNAVLDLLLEEALERQILLFTCREQEAERILAHQDAQVTLVELSEKSMV